MKENREVLIAYFSPSGSTEHVAAVFKKKMVGLGRPARMISLGGDSPSPWSGQMDSSCTCLFIGSPVYAGHPAPPVMDFISRLPPSGRGYSVPFVTWGAVSSGIALYEMGKALTERGYPVIGAAKILSKHSLMWGDPEPLGADHPDAREDGLIERLSDNIDERLGRTEPTFLPLSRLDYQPRDLRTQLEGRSFDSVKPHFPPREVIGERCTFCGICRAHCPVGALALSPYPEFGPGCVFCFNCARLCPENAIASDLSPLLARIRKRAEDLQERPRSETYL